MDRNYLNITNDLGLWPILRQVPFDHLHKIDQFYIFNNGKSILYQMVGPEKEVFAYGKSNVSKFPIQQRSLIRNDEPIPIPMLNGEPFIVEEGMQHMVALTVKTGRLFAWGSDRGFRNNEHGSYSELKSIEFIMGNVAKVCCGHSHTIILSLQKEVYFFGKMYDPNSISNENPINLPGRTSLPLMNVPIIDIASSQNAALFMDEEHNLYVYGFCEINRTEIDQFVINPILFLKLEQPITQMIGLNNYFVWINEKGEIFFSNGRRYMFGRFSQQRSNDDHPNKFQTNGYHFTDHQQPVERMIVSKEFDNNKGPYSFSDQLIVKHSNGLFQIYESRQYCRTPMWFTSSSDVNALYINDNTPEMTILPSHMVDPSYIIQLNDFNVKQFQGELSSCSDTIVTFLLENRRPIYARRSFLMERSEYFRMNFLSSRWKQILKEHNNTIKIHKYSYAVYYAYIKYLYTDSLYIVRDLQSLLFCLAHYNGEKDLIAKLVRNYPCQDDGHKQHKTYNHLDVAKNYFLSFSLKTN